MRICTGPNYEVESGRLYSAVYFAFTEGFYPCEGWEDFVVTCLTCWYIAIRKCRKNHKTLLMFFDGGESLTYWKGERDTATLSFHDTATNTDIQCNIHTSDLIRGILNACTDVLNAAQKHCISCADLDGLDRWVERRKRYLQ